MKLKKPTTPNYQSKTENLPPTSSPPKNSGTISHVGKSAKIFQGGGKMDDLAVTPFWSGYISGLQKLNPQQPTPLYAWGEKDRSTTLQNFLKKADPSIDPHDFAYSITRHWQVVREFLDDQIEGFEPISDIPTLYSFRAHLANLIRWFTDCYVANGRTTLASIGIAYVPKAKWNYTPPKTEELPTKEELLTRLLAKRVAG